MASTGNDFLLFALYLIAQSILSIPLAFTLFHFRKMRGIEIKYVLVGYLLTLPFLLETFLVQKVERDLIDAKSGGVHEVIFYNIFWRNLVVGTEINPKPDAQKSCWPRWPEKGDVMIFAINGDFPNFYYKTAKESIGGHPINWFSSYLLRTKTPWQPTGVRLRINRPVPKTCYSKAKILLGFEYPRIWSKIIEITVSFLIVYGSLISLFSKRAYRQS